MNREAVDRSGAGGGEGSSVAEHCSGVLPIFAQGFTSPPPSPLYEMKVSNSCDIMVKLPA